MDKFHELLTKKIGGLPVWAWGLIGIAGVGAGYLVIRYQQKQQAATAATSSTATDPGSSVVNATTQPTVAEPGSSLVPYTGGSTDSATGASYFPETSVNGQTVPVIPAGYQPIYDTTGALVGYEPIPPGGTTGIVPPSQINGTGSSSPGSTFKGPTGVLHYVATGGETLSQIASKFHLSGWNAVYGIPDNQRLFGKLNSSQAAQYKPALGQSITLPSSAVVNSSGPSTPESRRLR